MKYLKLVGMLMLAFLIVNSSAGDIIGTAGYVQDIISQDEEVTFQGTIFNDLGIAVYVRTMVIEFRETTADGDSSRGVKSYNITKDYDSEIGKLETNSSFSDTLTEKISYSPGPYDVSIWFVNSNNSDSSLFNSNAYALINQTVLVDGVNSTFEFILWVAGIGVSALIVVFIYSKSKRN